MQIYNGFIEASFEPRRKTNIAYSEVYTHLGGYDKTILFLHGLSSSKKLLLKSIVKELCERTRNSDIKLRIIAIDWPGHGNSDNNLKTYTLETLTRTIEEVQKALKLESFYLYGMSLGAMAAVKFSELNPGSVEGLFIQGTVINGKFWGDKGKTIKHVLELAEKMKLKAPNSLKLFPVKYLPILVYINPLFDIRQKDAQLLLNKIEGAEKIILDNIHQLSPRAFLGYTKDIMSAKLENSLVAINKSGIPVLVIDGERSEHIALDSLSYIKLFIPGADTLIVPDVGHLATIAYPEVIAEKIIEVLH